MPAALMDNFDRGSPFSQSDSQSPQDWSTVQSDGHKLQQREKNRDAARKTRRKQTEKADILHERFSMEFRSGDWAGHDRVLIRWSSIHTLIDLAVWHGALSCWKKQSSELGEHCQSRRKQVFFQDNLELQTLEQSNAAYVKEIDELRKEIQIYTTALEQHEPHCTKLSLCGPSLPISVCPSTATPPTSDFTFVSEPNPLQDLGFLSASPHNSLTDLLDSSDWSSWD
ncbi:uncharacterized protein LOC127446636 isoform X1 [Myxocyprinus asiaticus]|uniref:uncharacterized protein LOC127446636 isoform X1 n=1 Tax=Myxocyprinus asiaticus TaxID=70543 RepID=UPI0022216063|nr:uncharacterized protein LOC127446636 isoform X1 [Myxocyprinus asiaticus]